MLFASLLTRWPALAVAPVALVVVFAAVSLGAALVLLALARSLIVVRLALSPFVDLRARRSIVRIPVPAVRAH